MINSLKIAQRAYDLKKDQEKYKAQKTPKKDFDCNIFPNHKCQTCGGQLIPSFPHPEREHDTLWECVVCHICWEETPNSLRRRGLERLLY